LLENNAGVNARTRKDGCTPLYTASSHGHAEVVKLLLDYDADSNVCHYNGKKPIDAARQKHHLDIVRLLQ